MKFKLRRYYLYYLAKMVAIFFSLLPLKIALYLASLLGELVFLLLARYRRIAVDNLKGAFGDRKTDDEIRRIAAGVFKNLAMNAVELVRFPKITAANIDRFVEIRNKDIIDKALQEGRGALVITAHFGNWELIASVFSLKGYKGAVIGRRIYFDKYDQYLNSLRKSHNVHIIYRDESPKKILRVLKDNGIMGILADQDVDSVDGVFVDFFGRKAYTPTGPVLLARASGAKLIPAFAVRDGSRHVIMVEEPIELDDTGNKESDIINNTQKWSNVVESYIKRYPDQWVWIHRRWKTKE